MLDLSDKDFKATIIKMFQWAMTNMLKTNEIESQQRNRRYEEPNGNLRTEEHNNWNKISMDVLKSRMEGTEGRISRWKIEQ